MKYTCALSLAVILGGGTSVAATVEHGRTNYTETGSGNTFTVHSREGGSAGFDVIGLNRGDVEVTFTGSADIPNEFSGGVAISSPLSANFNNLFTPDGHATTAVDRNSAGNYLISTFHVTSGVETNVEVAVGYFKYSDGWLGGVFRNTSNGGPLADSVSSFAPGVSLAAGTVIDQGGGTTLVDLRAFRVLLADGVPASSANPEIS